MKQEKEQLHIADLTWQLHDERIILDHIGLDFLHGDFYGILGPNGSGKTSLIRHILRFIETKQGQLLLDERELSKYKRKELAKNLALVPQNTNMDSAFTAYDVVMMGRSPYQKAFAQNSIEDEKIVKDSMDMTNCYHLRDQMYSNLSGGEAQRVITARAIAQQTPWLILDEPVSHLDIRYQVELMEQLKGLNENKGISILAVLHDINLSCRYCKKIVLMKQGKIIAHGPTEEVMTLENLEYVYEMKFLRLCPEELGRSIFVAKP